MPPKTTKRAAATRATTAAPASPTTTAEPAAPPPLPPTVCNLKANEYMHVEDADTCEVLTVVGPIAFPLKKRHTVLFDQPKPCVIVPPNHVVGVRNPVHRHGPEVPPGQATAGYPLVSVDKTLLQNPTSCTALLGTKEYRFSQTPFPLFPGEAVDGTPYAQPLLTAQQALLLECTAAFTYSAAEWASHAGGAALPAGREAGERYYFKGPGLYRPRVGEKRLDVVTALLLRDTQAVYLVATDAFVEEDGTVRHAEERWTVRTTGSYFPPPHARVEGVREAVPLRAGTALQVRALGDFVDSYTGTRRRAGEVWRVTCKTTAGAAYVPCHLEEVVCEGLRQVVLGERQYCVLRNPMSAANGVPAWGARQLVVGPRSFFLQPQEVMETGVARTAYSLTADEALLVVATEAFTDDAGVVRPVAVRWLVRGPCAYIPPLAVRVLERRHVIALSHSEGVYVHNTLTGEIRSVRGRPFMLSADEELWEKPVSRYVRRLMEAPRLCIRAQEVPDIIADWKLSSLGDAAAMLGAGAAAASSPTVAAQGQRQGQWHHQDSNSSDDDDDDDDEDEDSDWGNNEVRADRPTTCHLSPVQPIPVEYDEDGVRLQPRSIRRYTVVSVNVEHNTLVRLQDTNKGTSRVVAGPAAVGLEPYEEFASLTLSGGRPKQPNQIHTLSLFLGPDYMSDVIEVETLDHARLKLELAYNWEFDTSNTEDGALHLGFTIPDFVGEACKALASRVRIAIASATFESFHRNSATVIRQAIFSAAADGETELRSDALYFTVNGLRITNVDLQSVEPVDPKTRTALTKSVQLAVEIITKSQENEATQHAALNEQEAKGTLDLQVVRDKATAEKERVALMEVVVHNAAVEQGSASKVQALAESEARLVEARSELDVTPIRCSAHELGIDAELDILRRRMEADLAHRAAMNTLQVARAAALAGVEAAKYESIMAALGDATIVAIAQAGPELKARLLGALGLQGFLVTDGSSPINLMNVAKQITAPSASK